MKTAVQILDREKVSSSHTQKGEGRNQSGCTKMRLRSRQAVNFFSKKNTHQEKAAAFPTRNNLIL